MVADNISNDELGLILAVTEGVGLKELYASPKSLVLDSNHMFSFQKKFVDSPLETIREINDMILDYFRSASLDPQGARIRQQLSAAVKLEISSDVMVSELHRYDQLFRDDGRASLPSYVMDGFEYFEDSDAGTRVFRVSKQDELMNLLGAKSYLILNGMDARGLAHQIKKHIHKYNELADSVIEKENERCRSGGSQIDPARKIQQLTQKLGKCMAYRDEADTNTILFQIMAQTAGFESQMEYLDSRQEADPRKLACELSVGDFKELITLPSYNINMKPVPEIEEVSAAHVSDVPSTSSEPNNQEDEPIELSFDVYRKAGFGRSNVESALTTFTNQNRDWLYKNSGKRFLIIPECADLGVADSCTNPKTLSDVFSFICATMQPEEVVIATDLELGGKDATTVRTADEDTIDRMVDEAVEKLGYADAIDDAIAQLQLSGEPAVFFHDLTSLSHIDSNGARVRDVSNYVVVSISHPKMHNKFLYAGACHSLSALVEPETRELIGQANGDKENVLADVTYDILQTEPNLLNVLDGSRLMVDHQAYGRVLDANMVAVSVNPLALDQSTLEFLGIPLHKIPYVSILYQRFWEDPEVHGMESRITTPFSDMQTAKGYYPSNQQAGVIVSFQLDEPTNDKFEGALIDLKS